MKNVEDEINKTMDSLDGAERAKANPFLYAKIQHRLQERSLPVTWWIRLPQPLRVALLGLILLVNIWTITSNWQYKVSPSDNSTAFAESMGLTSTYQSFYP